MNKKHFLIVVGIIIVFVVSYIVYDQTRYTSFENEFTEIQNYYSNHGEGWNISEIELTYFDVENDKGFSTVIDDSSTIKSIYEQLMSTELKKTSTSNKSHEKSNFRLSLSYSEGRPTTVMHILYNRIYISEPFLHMTYKEVDSNQFYSFLEGLDLSWDREFQLSERE
ncbi:hypothetical protein [Ornithinibacillus sp. 179-J 7C1 HS]|uniref:hypothetical protein n=1 Tax=Ornithinibacillus sp. 179-J 7C1 HS TaxID=3142384 RepID=UPI00399FA85C